MSRNQSAGYAFLVIALLLWGSNTVLGRVAMTSGEVPPVALNLWRWTGALIVLLPFSALKVWTLRHQFIRRWWYYTVFALVGVACFNTFFYIGLRSTTAVQGSLITSILPMLVVVWSAIFVGMRITGRHIAGLVLSIGGAALVILRGDIGVLGTFALNNGDLWCLGAVLAWSIQTFLLRFKPAEIDMLSFATVTIALGVVMLLPVYAIETTIMPAMVWTIETIAMVAYLAVGASAVAYTLWNAGGVRIGTTAAGYVANLFPVFSALLAVLILGEAIAWYHGLGGALVLAGIYLATVPAKAGGRAEMPAGR